MGKITYPVDTGASFSVRDLVAILDRGESAIRRALERGEIEGYRDPRGAWRIPAVPFARQLRRERFALNLEEAARTLGVHRMVIQRAIDRGELEADRVGRRGWRISSCQLAAWAHRAGNRPQLSKPQRTQEERTR